MKTNPLIDIEILWRYQEKAMRESTLRTVNW